MKDHITISELARLMNVSHHQIRYFEEKGILPPAYIDNNGYRMYGMEQVYRLSHILLLRKLGEPVPSIKNCMDNYKAEQYERLLERAVDNIDAEMRRLEETKRFIAKVISEHNSSRQQMDRFSVKQKQAVTLMEWLRFEVHEYAEGISAKRLAERGQEVGNLFEQDIHYLFDESNVLTLCVESAEPDAMTLPSGKYLTIQKPVQAEDELDAIIARFYTYATQHSLSLSGPLVLIERSYLSMFHKNELVYELQALIRQDTEAGH
ncbi:MerR family transcriptional regulator [Paenibacillus sp. J5C_2022]|uniref:MerR family transcriptional regulator n=1 Tax=Paenibacillus sp. J5C2022 TaxID=2977129 RepID=UPI0021D396FB|nr:MerR family transcriptional regulator [Paenibacillus sp. J5C2022]MCU6707892.1 MerR family transcriptional regulator [Paenibacillus sp. J5C2022]